MRTRVKICGLTRPADVQAAAQAGCDAVGLVFHPASPRAVDVITARELTAALPPFVTAVALFLDADADRVVEVVEQVRPHLLQFHGNESPDYCNSFGVPYIKAISMASGQPAGFDDYPDASALLLDSHAPGGMGGTGQVFDWSSLPAQGQRLILAGGLTPENVGEAVRQGRPYAVDVSSGVESSPGIKDNESMQRFIQAVRDSDGC